jgi:D-lactate dehydrogenase
VETEVDACIECGFCEHKCPSRDLTMTPRRRIVARRALQQFNSQSSKKQHKELLKQYQYEGMDTCAVDGLCATACPVDIDTGKLVKRLRKEKHGQLSILIANSIARNFGIAAVFVRWALKLGGFLNRIFGKNAMRNLTRAIRKLAPAFPLWSNQLSAAPPKTQWKIKEKQSSVNSIVYFPSCINRVMGEKDGGPSVVQHFTSVADKLGIDLYIPPGIGNICCGQIFSSKGFADAYAYKANQFVEHLWDWSQDGKRPIVIDFSSCVYTAIQSAYVLSPANKKKLNRIRILETIQFLQEYVIPLSGNIHKKKSIAIHPVCSLEKLGINNMLKEVANHFAETVFISNKAGCCGMAGDRGFLFPELTQSACHEQASETKQQHVEGFYSTSKTCELAMSEAVGQDFHSIIRLVDECVD